MCCGNSSKIIPIQDSIRAVDNNTISVGQKQQTIIVVIDETKNEKVTSDLLKSLKKVCSQDRIEQKSWKDANKFIHELNGNINVILIIPYDSWEQIKNTSSMVNSLSTIVRNVFIYTNENESAENPTGSIIQYVDGKSHLLSAINDVLSVVNPSPIYPQPDRDFTIVIHQNILNKLFKSIGSIQFPYDLEWGLHIHICDIKLSRMEIAISPALFQFKAYVEIFGRVSIFDEFLKKETHGECELVFNESNNKLELKIKKFIIQIPKLDGPRDISNWIPTFPLDGYIDVPHSIELFPMCENKQLEVILHNPVFIYGNRRVTISITIDCNNNTQKTVEIHDS